MEPAKAYEPKIVEDKIYQFWLESGFFSPAEAQAKAGNPNKNKTFTIVLPPPNVTGELHMGHALNATIQDILIRQKRMQGFKTLWVPGTDHAGIATQNVVEKKLKKEGKTRFDLGKEKFIEEVWAWKEKYGHAILGQLKRLGASCDWSRTRFTMDKDYAQAVNAAFLHYYKKGWIYQGERVVNWCPRCATSLSDLELEYREEKSSLWYIKYPLAQKPEIRNPKSETNSKFKIQNSKFTIAAAIDKAVFPGLQGGPHLNQIAAVAVALREAAEPSFKKYAAQVVKNAQALAEALAERGWRIVSGGTDTHLLLVDTWMGGTGIGGKEASERLEREGIIVNKNTIPFDTRSPMDPSGIRLGTPAETTRGAKEKDMREIAERIDKALRKK